MTQDDIEFWEKAATAREELLDQYGEDPDVKLIDIGYAPEEAQAEDEVVLRIHMSDEWCAEHSADQATFTEEVDGIPVHVICDGEEPD